MKEFKEIFEGNFSAIGMKFALVASRFNSAVTDRLVTGAQDAFLRSGGTIDDVTLVRIPGAWEFGVTVRALAEQKRFDAIVCVGAVIRGDTPHFDYVAGESAGSIARAAADFGVPIANGILTTDTFEQAVDRAGGKSGNKGFDAAMTAIEMANLLKKLRAKT